MSKNSIPLNKRQVEFLINMLELADPQSAMERFAEIMVLEGVSPVEMGFVIDRIMKEWAKRK